MFAKTHSSLFYIERSAETGLRSQLRSTMYEESSEQSSPGIDRSFYFQIVSKSVLLTTEQGEVSWSFFFSFSDILRTFVSECMLHKRFSMARNAQNMIFFLPGHGIRSMTRYGSDFFVLLAHESRAQNGKFDTEDLNLTMRFRAVKNSKTTTRL